MSGLKIAHYGVYLLSLIQNLNGFWYIAFRTPLHWAAAMGHVECLRTLLKLGVSPNPVDIDGGSPLEYAKQAGHKGEKYVQVIHYLP